MKFDIPPLLKLEHQEMMAELVEAARLAGPVGEAAREVLHVLRPHFLKEEEFALPPLGLLRPLAENKVSPEMADFQNLTDRLRIEYRRMVHEHFHILLALEKLSLAARGSRKAKYEELAQRMILHTQEEEEILYPASLLVGKVLKTELEK